MTPALPGTRPLSRLRAAFAVTGLLLLSLLLSCKGQATPTPVSSPAPQRAPAAPSAPAATATASPLDAKLREVEDRVLGIRGLARPADVPHRFVMQSEMQARIGEELSDPETAGDLKTAEAVYKLLGLIPQDASLERLYRELLGAQVLGLYDDEKEEFLVLQTGAEFGPGEESTYVHEYVHRLQDAHFDLTALLEATDGADPASGAGPSDRDAALAALVEGDATAAQTTYILRYIGFARMAEMLQKAQEAEALTRSIPYVLRRSLEFPYDEGTRFVASLRAAGGQVRVDAAFQSPPVTTEQVIHPEKFLSGEAPVAVPLAPGDALGPGWSSADTDSFGELFIRTWLESLGAAGATAASAAAGWGGDAFRLYSGPQGASALVAVIVWDDPQRDPAEFFNALSAALTGAPGFARQPSALPGAVSFWNGPGGVIGLARAQAPSFWGVAAVFAVAPSQGLVVSALGALSSGP